MWNRIVDIFRTEPTVAIGAIGGVVDAAIVVAVDFGAHIQPNQVLGIDGFIVAFGGAVTLFAIRSQVTPVAKAAPAVLPPPAPMTPGPPPAP